MMISLLAATLEISWCRLLSSLTNVAMASANLE